VRRVGMHLRRRLRTRYAPHLLLLTLGGGTVAAPVLRAQTRAPVIQDRVRLDPSEPVGFHVLLTPDTVFVGQQATYEIGVFITESAQQRMRRNPEVVPAELRGVLAYDLGGPQSLPALTQNGTRTFPHVLQRALFPLAAGRLDIPASQLTYTLPRSTSFFSREESAVMRANDVALHVRPLPRTGQPDDFSGAVGVLGLRASVDTPDARVGEPVLLTVRVTGRGNVKLWPRPEVVTPGAALVPAGERVAVDTSGQYVRGTKEFDWLVTPEREGPLAVPVIEYAYFDPYDASYRVARSEPIGITIAAGEFVSAPDVERDGLSVRTLDRGARREPLSRHPLLWALLAVAPLPALRRRRSVGEWARDRTRASAVPDAPSRPVELSAHERVRRSAAESRKQLLVVLATRLGTTAPSLAAHAALERRLRRRGVTQGTTQQVLALVADLDAVAWAREARGAWQDDADLRARTDALLAQVALEAIPATSGNGEAPHRRRTSAAPLMMGLLAIAGGAAALHARSPQSAGFADGVHAFGQQRYADAAAYFVELAIAEPRHADAWANAGTAAWAAHDTVGAVRGWQRALRLEPHAVDMRRSLALLPSASWGGVAHVPNVPRDAGTIVAALLWCLGWMGVAWARRVTARLPGTDAARVGRAVPVGLLVLAVILGGWQWRLEQQLSPAPLSVVARAEPLLVAPGRDASTFGGTSQGDLVRVGESRREGASSDAWARVTHADGRTGWLPSSALVPLK